MSELVSTEIVLQAGSAMVIDGMVFLHVLAVDQRGSLAKELGTVKIGIDAPRQVQIVRCESIKSTGGGSTGR